MNCQRASRTARTRSTWYARGENFVVSYSEATPGTVLSREEQVDEYFVLVPERGIEVTIATPGRPGCWRGTAW